MWVEECGGTWWVAGAFGSWRVKQLPELLVQPSTGRPGVMFRTSLQDAVYTVQQCFFCNIGIVLKHQVRTEKGHGLALPVGLRCQQISLVFVAVRQRLEKP